MIIAIVIEVIYGLIGLNIVTASAAIYFWRRSRLQAQRPESIELQEFLADLLSGGSLIHCKRIAPADALIHVRHKR